MMFETIGERICYCRNLLNLSQREFAIEFDLSKPTISRWESNLVKIPIKRLNTLVELLKNHGILVSTHWINTGIGTPPINQNAETIDTLNFDEIAYLTLNNIRQKIKDFEILQLNTKFFEPIFAYADYVAGVPTNDKSSLNGKLCFVVTSKDIIAGIYNYTDKTLKNVFDKLYYLNDNIFTIGEVLWSAKRF